MTQYFRPGDEQFHGKHCPENISITMLINQTFIPENVYDPGNPAICNDAGNASFFSVDAILDDSSIALGNFKIW